MVLCYGLIGPGDWTACDCNRLHSIQSAYRRVFAQVLVSTLMSGLSSIFPFKGLSSISPRDRPPDPVSRLRATLESMPGARKYIFTPTTRTDILSELYDAFWGPYSHLFLPNSNSSLPLPATLAEVQARLNFAGAALNDPPVPGRPCGYIFKKGESCFRCKSVLYT